MALKKRRECERPLHHQPRRRKAGVVGIHIPQMDLAFVCDGRATEQLIVAIKRRYVDTALRQRQCDTTSLMSAAQNPDAHMQHSSRLLNLVRG